MLDAGAPLGLKFPASSFSLSVQAVLAPREVPFLWRPPYLVGLQGLEPQGLP